MNWAGAVAIGDDVKPAYRDAYNSLKNAIHQAVPQSAALAERLSNLLAAQSDLNQLAKIEEVGHGTGVLRGKIGSSLLGAVQSSAGRLLPAAPSLAAPAPKGVIGSMVSVVAQRQDQQ